MATETTADGIRRPPPPSTGGTEEECKDDGPFNAGDRVVDESPLSSDAIFRQAYIRPSTSESYNFVNVPFDVDRGGKFVNATVAIIDGCRHMDEPCNVKELTFLSDPDGLVDYKIVGNPCSCCFNQNHQPRSVGISGHGYFCAAIVASRKIPNARIEDVRLGTVTGISPPPRIALYGIGCPSCLRMTGTGMVEAIQAAIEKGVTVISMSLADTIDETSPEYHERDLMILEALKHDILTVTTAGNNGQIGLRSIAKTAPWCLTVGSCTPKRKYRTLIRFGGHVIDPFDIEVESINMIGPGDIWSPLRLCGKIEGKKCRLYLENDLFVIEPCSDHGVYPPSGIPVVNIPAQHTTKISMAINQALLEEEHVYVQIASSVKVDVPNSPIPSDFSSRGPCWYFKEFMKPDLCAPGEEIAAAWPSDEPLGGLGRPYFADFNILSGTSFAAPQVAAAIAILRAEQNFSATAAFSAVITSATKMHGKDRIAGEYAYGAGMLNIRKAMRPGMVFEESASRHLECFHGSLLPSDLNLPSMSATFPIGDTPLSYTFNRRARNVENSRCSYKLKLQRNSSSLQISQDLIEVHVTPRRLTFEGFGDELDFSVSVRIPHTRVVGRRFGLVSMSVIWQNEENEDITVDCPLVLSARKIPIVLGDY
ncbi:hypothetical protein RND81_12G224400 [Saponaria officinalis]|uniref:Uncharacterized protein n=1 Tax=Saponaria officinalis TaxID=3572 RepID=A0AAW1HDX9_SAPOF